MYFITFNLELMQMRCFYCNEEVDIIPPEKYDNVFSVPIIICDKCNKFWLEYNENNPI